jgi:type III secretion protein J
MRGALLLLVLAAACSTPIRHGLDEPAANEVTTALERAGIGAEKLADEAAGPSTFVVRVAQGDAVKALDLLHTLGLPRGRRTGFAEVYGQPSLIPTATEERARYVEALAGEIERTLETVDGVAGARVHLVMEETDPLDSKPRVAAQAAVLLKTRPGLPQLADGDIKKLVAGSVPGLAAAAVTVVATPAAEAPANPSLAPVGPLRVTPGTRGLLIATLIVALAVLAVLATLLFYTARRLAAAQRALERG